MLNNGVFRLSSEMTLCTFLAAVLFGCGGGDRDASTDSSALSTRAPVISPSTDPAWTTIAAEGGSFSVTGLQVVRYGADAGWAQRAMTGSGQCTNALFGHDPAPGSVKSCQIPSGVAAPASTLSVPKVDVAKIPAPAIGISTMNVSATNEVAPATGEEGGAFRTSCVISHMGFDDPIVFPGQPGRSHLHTFFGNVGANANSTAESLRDSGNSTCRGGIANRSAYWVPTMIDTRDGTPLVPDSIGVYYKSGDIAGAVIKPIPAGLRMIAGDPKRAVADSATYSSRFKCIGGPNSQNDKYGPGIPNCDVGAEVWSEVFFPHCWDGVNLDSPDHKSHMSYTVTEQVPGQSHFRAICPSTHPVVLPGITFNVVYKVTEKDAPLRWRLASDAYDTSLPGGYSSHADWFNGWKSDISDAWANHCVQAKKDCHSHLLGDGRQIF